MISVELIDILLAVFRDTKLLAEEEIIESYESNQWPEIYEYNMEETMRQKLCNSVYDWMEWRELINNLRQIKRDLSM